MQKLSASKLAGIHPLFPAMMSAMFLVIAASFAVVFAQVQAVFPPEVTEFSKASEASLGDWLLCAILGRPWFGLCVGLAVGCVAYGLEKRKWRRLLQDPENIQRQADLLKLRPLPALWQALLGRDTFAISRTILLGLLTVVVLALLLKFSVKTSIYAFCGGWVLLCPEYRRLYDGVLAVWQREAGSNEEEVLLVQAVRRRARGFVLLQVFAVAGLCILLIHQVASLQGLSDDLGSNSGTRYSLVSTGEELTPEEAEEVERRFERDPDNPNPRLLLFGYYGKHREESERTRKQHARHALWHVQAFPREYVPRENGTGILTPERDSEAYEKAATIWREHVEHWPEDCEILSRAVGFFFHSNKDYAAQLLEQGEALRPGKSWWPEELGRLHADGLFARPETERGEAAKLALAAYERALKLTEGEMNKLWLLLSVAPVALEAGDHDTARRAAEEFVAGAADLGLSSQGWAVHLAHTILGRLALQNGDVAGAQGRLRESLASLDAHDRKTFRPRFTLARDLLEQGQSEPVLEFLAECAKFWDAPEYVEWAVAIQEGRTPDFGEAVEGGPE